MKGLLRFSSLVVAALGIGIASQTAHAENAGDPDRLCSVNDWQRNTVAKMCEPGEKIIFLPESFGNEQLPIIFAAVNCDLRHAVVSSKGAVTCIYRPIKPLEHDQDSSDENETE